MTFQEAEKTYKDLRSQHASGKLTDADFEAQVNQLRVQDAQGRWWQLGVRTGEWYFNDGQKWVKGKPPTSTTTSAVPTSPPEAKAEPIEDKADRPRVMPRGIFSPRPEEHNGGGLSRPVLIGIIAGVALLVIAVFIGGYFLISGAFLGGAARATPTRTVAVAAQPTAPVIAPATNTPAVTETPLPAATLVVTVTNTLAVTPTPTGPRATATRRPPTATPQPAGPSPTPPPPPGFYVTKVELASEFLPLEPNRAFRFRVTFLNNGGAGELFEKRWRIRIFQINKQDTAFGNTALKTIELKSGTYQLLSEEYKVGPAGPPDCNYVAGAYYLDDNQVQVPFPNIDGKQFRFLFDLCR